MKVKAQFYCTQEKKSYVPGDTYTGKRKDLGAYLEADGKPVTEDKDGAPKKATKAKTKAKRTPRPKKK